jgi:hypothetical protein
MSQDNRNSKFDLHQGNEKVLGLPEFLKNKNFINGKSPNYVLIPENDDFLKGKFPSFA